MALFTDNYGPSPSGLLFAVQFLERELLAAGFEVLVVAPATDGPNPYRDHPLRSEKRLPSIKLPGVPVAVAGGRGFERALDEFAADPPDIIHVHGLGPIGLLGVWAADRVERPLLVTWHTDFEAYADHYAMLTPFMDAFYQLLKVATRGMKRPQLQEMRRWLVDRNWLSLRRLRFRLRGGSLSRRSLLNAARGMLEAAELVTAPSDKTALRVRELAFRSRIRVVPNGLDALPEGRPLPAASGPRILYVGRIAPEKNIALLVDAFAWVREEIPNAELMFVGDWKVSSTLAQKLRSARRRGGVTLVGQVPRDDLGPYYASADVFAFPSTTDTQALVLHEAAHAGLPIVSVDPELRLVVDEGVNGLFARPTPESLARQLVSMIRRLESPDFAARAHARSREMASWWTIHHQSEAIISLYRDLAAGRPVAESMHAIPPDGDAVPGGTIPGAAVPGGAVPGGAVPGGAVPGGAVPGGAAARSGDVGGAEPGLPAGGDAPDPDEDAPGGNDRGRPEEASDGSGPGERGAP
ncbi:glycosyltransferase family 4 protein [Propioniciclava coleopterorum]|uniref:Glycosyltransferase family 4 protein n=1 Tax=Propioniciclava coleopterorum TaxID=2714937 RepID=A0A6G7Y6Y9_9ACTN|nr:glycosyltransferase [Propioniciclava coleopterorum]QIK72553.1 glycosyltransferase family 4 protein [Propioniciclava coleopterorum]